MKTLKYFNKNFKKKWKSGHIQKSKDYPICQNTIVPVKTTLITIIIYAAKPDKSHETIKWG